MRNRVLTKPPFPRLRSAPGSFNGLHPKSKFLAIGVSKPVGMRLTAADDSKSEKANRSAAQKAALRLDA